MVKMAEGISYLSTPYRLTIIFQASAGENRFFEFVDTSSGG